MPKLRHTIKVTNPKTKKESEITFSGLQDFSYLPRPRIPRAYYETNFALVQHHKYSITELENMLPWDGDIYIGLLLTHLKEEKDKHRREMMTKGGKNLRCKI